MEYRISKGWRIFTYIGAPLIILVAFLAIRQMQDTDKTFSLLNLLGSSSIILTSFFFAVYSVIRMRREKLTIQEDRFVYQLAFKVKEMRFEEIKGFRIDEAYFRILPKSESLKPLNISRYLERKQDFINFLYENFEDLTAQDRAKEAAEIVSNKDFGDDNFERDDRFALAKKQQNG